MNDESLTYPGRLSDDPRSRATMRKVTIRLVPFLLLLYICNLLDRGNVSFVKSRIQVDLEMSDAAYSLGAGLFYFGYLLFEVPSNLILRRTGARIWISRIMITWGLVSCCTMFVTGPWSFYAVRVLLGVAEAGFFPGIIYYLTYWFPARERTRAVASFMAANAVGGIITNMLSGAIMKHLSEAGGLHGWQWVFLLEGIPSVVFGVMVLFYLTDRPEQATWLSEEDRRWLSEWMSQEEQKKHQRHGADFVRALMDRRVWLLILLYFTIAFSANAGGLYLPELIRHAFPDRDEAKIGFLAALPSLCGLIGMLVNGWWADQTGKHRLHVIVPAFLTAGGWILTAAANSPELILVGLCVTWTGMMSMLPPFWSLPTSFLSGAAAAGGIALINSVGNIGGLTGPPALGLIVDATKELTWGLICLALIMILGGILAMFVWNDPHSPANTKSS